MRANFTLEDHKRLVDAAKRRGAHSLTVKMPCCERELEFRAPKGDDVWDDIRMCPICGTVWQTTTAYDSIAFFNPGFGIITRREE